MQVEKSEYGKKLSGHETNKFQGPNYIFCLQSSRVGIPIDSTV